MKKLLNKGKSILAVVSAFAILAVSMFSALSGITFTAKADANASILTGTDNELSLLDATQPNSRSNPFIIENANQMHALMRGLSTNNGEKIDTTGKYFKVADSIDAFNDEERKNGNGFKFYTYNAHEMLYVVKDAIYTFGDKKQWLKLIKCAMKTDFSWKKSAIEYEKLYNDILM